MFQSFLLLIIINKNQKYTATAFATVVLPVPGVPVTKMFASLMFE